MNGEQTDPTELTPMSVWRPIEDYELRIQGAEMSAILQTLAAEYERGRGTHILENLLDAVHFRLGEMLVYAVADALRDSDCATDSIAMAVRKSRRIIRPFSGI